MLQVALNGTRTRTEHAGIPLTPAAQAIDAQASVAAGADAIHLHVRSEQGFESLAPADVKQTIDAIRRASPGIPVGISTGAWIVPHLETRLRLIRSWTTRPDFASVNFHEAGAALIAEALLERGVGVEAGIWNAPAAMALVESGLAHRCVRVLLEPSEACCRATINLEQIEHVLAGIAAPRLLHGLGRHAWRMLELAARRGYETRIGFEDTLRLPDGSVADSNAELVLTARRIIAGVRHEAGVIVDLP